MYLKTLSTYFQSLGEFLSAMGQNQKVGEVKIRSVKEEVQGFGKWDKILEIDT